MCLRPGSLPIVKEVEFTGNKKISTSQIRDVQEADVWVMDLKTSAN